MSEIETLRQENVRLKNHYHCCLFCGEKMLSDTLLAAGKISDHILICPEHPMRQLEAALDKVLPYAEAAFRLENADFETDADAALALAECREEFHAYGWFRQDVLETRRGKR